MINPSHLQNEIIRPVLKKLDMYSESAVKLLLLTAAVESDMGYSLVQKHSGPALGIYQMEPTTYKDIHDNYLKYRPLIKIKVNRYKIFHLNMKSHSQLIGNFYYATAMCRVHYWRVTEPLPEADNITGLANYWKEYYNSYLGKGTVLKAVQKYKLYEPAKKYRNIIVT